MRSTLLKWDPPTLPPELQGDTYQAETGFITYLQAFKESLPLYEKEGVRSSDMIHFYLDNKQILEEYKELEENYRKVNKEYKESQTKPDQKSDQSKEDLVREAVSKISEFKINHRKFFLKWHVLQQQAIALRGSFSTLDQSFWEKLEERDQSPVKRAELIKLKEQWISHRQFAPYDSQILLQLLKRVKTIETGLFNFVQHLIEKYGSINDKNLPPNVKKFMEETGGSLAEIRAMKKSILISLQMRLKAADHFRDLSCDDVMAYTYDKARELFPHLPQIQRYRIVKETEEDVVSQELTQQEQKIIDAKQQDLYVPEEGGILEELPSWYMTTGDVAEIKDRHQRLLEVLKKAEVVNKLSKVLNSLIQSQQVGIDLISSAIKRARDNCEKAYQSILHAENSQSESMGGDEKFAEMVIDDLEEFIENINEILFSRNIPVEIPPRKKGEKPKTWLDKCKQAFSQWVGTSTSSFAEVLRQALESLDRDERIMKKHSKDYKKLVREVKQKEFYRERDQPDEHADSKYIIEALPSEIVDEANEIKRATQPSPPIETGMLLTGLTPELASEFYQELSDYFEKSQESKKSPIDMNEINKLLLFDNKFRKYIIRRKNKDEDEDKSIQPTSPDRRLHLLATDPVIWFPLNYLPLDKNLHPDYHVNEEETILNHLQDDGTPDWMQPSLTLLQQARDRFNELSKGLAPKDPLVLHVKERLETQERRLNSKMNYLADLSITEINKDLNDFFLTINNDKKDDDVKNLVKKLLAVTALLKRQYPTAYIDKLNIFDHITKSYREQLKNAIRLGKADYDIDRSIKTNYALLLSYYYLGNNSVADSIRIKLNLVTSHLNALETFKPGKIPSDTNIKNAVSTALSRVEYEFGKNQSQKLADSVIALHHDQALHNLTRARTSEGLMILVPNDLNFDQSKCILSILPGNPLVRASLGSTCK